MSDDNGGSNCKKYDPLEALGEMVKNVPQLVGTSSDQSNRQQQPQQKNRKKKVGRLHYNVSSVADEYFSFVYVSVA